MNLKNNLLSVIQNQKRPEFIISKATEELRIKRELISKALIDLKKEGQIFYIIKTPDILYITHINGEELDWDSINPIEEVEDSGNGLFDREGNIFIEPIEFFNYISSLPASSKHENELLFKELEYLKDDDYDLKVLEIATKNIKLIRRLIFPVIENEDLSETEIREYYRYVLSGLCRSIEKFDYKMGYSLSTLSSQWILQGSTRGRSKIIQKRMLKKYGEQIALNKIDERAREIKNTTEQYPTYIELEDSFKKELEEKVKINEDKKSQRLKNIQEKLGINKLYNLVFTFGKIKSSYPTEQAVDKIFRSIELLDDQEKEIIILRYGLFKLLKKYNITLDNFKEFDGRFHYIDENGMTLEDIGSFYGLTRERIRQIENISIEKLKYFISGNDPSKEIPIIFFPQNFKKFFTTNNLHTIEDVISLNISELMNLQDSTKSKVKTLTKIFKSLGFEIKENVLKEGDIDFSQLSTRSTNALKKVGITTKQQLNNVSIETLPNIGSKSVIEIHQYLENDLENEEEIKHFYDIQTVLLFPCANKDSQQNFQYTMSSKISLDKVEQYLLPKQKQELEMIGEEFYFWGIKSTTDKGWEKISLKGAGLFFANKEAFAVGEIVYKFINKDLSEYFWRPEKDTNRSYKYMFAFSTIEEISIPQEDINHTLSYKENYVTQGFMGLNKIRSRDIVNLINLYKN
tara:strand:- start:2144 stop:4207 length:2064 start_codon:yes stop_codon:yes gene_type:complete